MKTLANALLLVWFALYELIFAAVAILSGLNPYVLAAIIVLCNGCLTIGYDAKMNPEKLPPIYQSQLVAKNIDMICFCAIVGTIVCLFVDWKIALIAYVVSLFVGKYVIKPFSRVLITDPLALLYAGLLKLGEKAQ